MPSDAMRQKAEGLVPVLRNIALMDEGYDTSRMYQNVLLNFAREYATKMVEAVPEKPMNPEITITETGHELYRAGWNACRAEMRKGVGNGL